MTSKFILCSGLISFLFCSPAFSQQPQRGKIQQESIIGGAKPATSDGRYLYPPVTKGTGGKITGIEGPRGSESTNSRSGSSRLNSAVHHAPPRNAMKSGGRGARRMGGGWRGGTGANLGAMGGTRMGR